MKTTDLRKIIKEEISKLLNEGKQVGILYHATNGANLLKILKTNTILGDLPYATEGGISFSRSSDDLGYGIYVLQLDGNKISNNYKITSYAFQGERVDAEESMIKNLKNLNKYLLNIYCRINAINNTRDYEEYIKIKKNYPSLIEIKGHYGLRTANENDIQQVKKELYALPKYIGNNTFEFKNNTIEFKKNNDTSFTGFTGYDEYYNGIFKTTIRSNTPIEKSDLQVIKNSFIRFK